MKVMSKSYFSPKILSKIGPFDIAKRESKNRKTKSKVITVSLLSSTYTIGSFNHEIK